MAKSRLGIVKWFDDAKGYGFITSKNGQDVFVHYTEITEITGEGRRTLSEGQEVDFKIRTTDKGLQAVEVVPLDTQHTQKEKPAPNKSQQIKRQHITKTGVTKAEAKLRYKEQKNQNKLELQLQKIRQSDKHQILSFLKELLQYALETNNKERYILREEAKDLTRNSQSIYKGISSAQKKADNAQSQLERAEGSLNWIEQNPPIFLFWPGVRQRWNAEKAAARQRVNRAKRACKRYQNQVAGIERSRERYDQIYDQVLSSLSKLQKRDEELYNSLAAILYFAVHGELPEDKTQLKQLY